MKMFLMDTAAELSKPPLVRYYLADQAVTALFGRRTDNCNAP